MSTNAPEAMDKPYVLISLNKVHLHLSWLATAAFFEYLPFSVTLFYNFFNFANSASESLDSIV